MTEQDPMTRAPSAWDEFLTGVKEESPLLLGVVPFGMIYGVLGVEAGLDPLVVFFMSSIVFGGASQVIVTQLAAASAGSLVIASTVGIVNLRHMLYSARMVEYLSGLGRGWKIILSYLLTDEAFFISLNRMENRPAGPFMHYHLLGTGLTLWVSWQFATLAGIMIGEAIPPSLGFGFAIPLTFLAITAPQIKSWPAAAALITSAVMALVCYEMPWNLWIITASLAGMAAGYITETARAGNQDGANKNGANKNGRGS